jgi:hypothetical protein
MAETLTTERAAPRISAFSLGLETLSAVHGSLGFTTVGRFVRGSIGRWKKDATKFSCAVGKVPSFELRRR